MQNQNEWGTTGPIYALNCTYEEADAKIKALSDEDLASAIRRRGPSVPLTADREDLENLAKWLWVAAFAGRGALSAEKHAKRPKSTPADDPFFD